MRIFHFDVGDGHFVEPITIGPIVLQSISKQIHEPGGVVDCHLMTETPRSTSRRSPRPAATASPSTTRRASDLPAVVARARVSSGLQVGLAFKPETAAEDAAPRP